MACPELPLQETLGFIERFLPRERSRILDVGSGSGELAELLSRAGHELVGLEPSAECVRAAIERGVDARVARFPDCDVASIGPAGFDAVVFSRALHHVDPLEPGLDRAAELTAPGGVLIVEDFAFTDVDARDVRWFHAALEEATARLELDFSARSFASRVWHADGSPTVLDTDPDHAHELRSTAEMRAAIEARFALELAEDAPYYYRYIGQVAPAGEAGEELVRAFLAKERAAIRSGAVHALGRRFVGRRAL